MQNRIISCLRELTGSTEPVTLTEVKTHLHITDSENDTELTAMITRVRRRVEDYCNISILAYDVTLTADLYNEIRLPYPPVAELDEVNYRNNSVGTPDYDTLTVDEYSEDGIGDVVLKSFRCGRHVITYSTEMDPVPDNLKLGMLEEILYRYENRGDETTGFSPGALLLIEPFRQLWL